ncbi:hypothetical protein bsdE14_17010 [Clostridium omnivorum]|uniref:Uncharacterized protein n=1 Tax=Clostridium omnivorum TaxID=1604902 RepID=A0ABQ5N561_9CLOT|nr:hypothetical protein bsdE14_17010 [Clostridium sp. E14]
MDRLTLLKKIYQALKPNGKFIFDVFTPLMRKKESCSWKLIYTDNTEANY